MSSKSDQGKDCGNDQPALTPLNIDWSCAELFQFNQHDPALISIVESMDVSLVPAVLLVGQQGIMYPNVPMKALLSTLMGDKVAGRSILEFLPKCEEILAQVYSGKACRPDEPIMFSQVVETRTSWFQLDFSPIANQHGIVVAVQGLANDVTHFVQRMQQLSENEQRLYLALESSGMIGIWDLDIKSNISTADANVARMLGLPQADCQRGLDNGFLIQAVHAEDRPKLIQELESAIRNKTSYRCKHRVSSRDGQVRWIIASGKSCYDEAGELVRLLGVMVDVTDQTETSLALEQSRFQFETLTETLPQIVWSCDEQGRHDYFSSRWSEFTGISPEEITEETWKQLVHPEHWEMVSRVWEDARIHGKPYDIDYRFRHHSGLYRWLRVMALPIHNDDGRITRWFGTSTDVHESYLVSAERERLAQEMERLATEDQLTEALTRRAFVERATSAINMAAERRTSVGLILLDIDHFKSINDTYGHPGGDKVLTMAAKRIKASVDQHDLFGRLGGEEFGVLLPECNSMQVLNIAERIRQAIYQDPITLDEGLQIPVTISLGVTAQISSVVDLHQLMLIADKALYKAKKSGRNRSVLLTSKLSAQ